MNYSAAILRAQIQAILEALGMPSDYIVTTVDAMVETDLRGVDSHGVGMVPAYLNMYRRGLIIFDAPIKEVKDLPSLALVDGGHGLGHPVGAYCMELAIKKCNETGVGMVVARNSNHYGAAGSYARRALVHGFIGLSTTGTPGMGLVPTFGKKAMLGTNPIAFAAPARRNPPFVLDMATTTVAIGKLAIAQRLGLPIPEGWALDETGAPTTDAGVAREARRLTALGGNRELGSHKGYGLATMVDILSSTLSGAAIPGVEDHLDRNNNSGGNVGHFFMAIDPNVLRDDGAFEDDLDDLIDALHATPPADENQPVLVAGDPEEECYATRQREGIPLADRLIDELEVVCLEVGCNFLLGV